MKMLFLVTDSEYEPNCLSALKDEGVTGYTVIPEVYGYGSSGAKMGDRQHPGASVLVFAVVPDDSAQKFVDAINRCVKEEKLCESTHAWILPVEGGVSGC